MRPPRPWPAIPKKEEPMFDPKSREALLKNLIDTWGEQGFMDALKIVVKHEEEALHKQPCETAAGQISPTEKAPPDLIRIKNKLVQLAQEREYMHAHLNRISNDLSVLIHGQGTLWKDRKCDEVMKGYDWSGLGIWSILEVLTAQIDNDSNTIANIIGRLDNGEPNA